MGTKTINLGKAFGYSLAAAGAGLALFDIFRAANGDITASVSLAEKFLTNAGAIAAGLGFAKASKTNEAPQPVTVAAEPQNPQHVRLILPDQRLIVA